MNVILNIVFALTNGMYNLHVLVSILAYSIVMVDDAEEHQGMHSYGREIRSRHALSFSPAHRRITESRL